MRFLYPVLHLSRSYTVTSSLERSRDLWHLSCSPRPLPSDFTDINSFMESIFPDGTNKVIHL